MRKADPSSDDPRHTPACLPIAQISDFVVEPAAFPKPLRDHVTGCAWCQRTIEVVHPSSAETPLGEHLAEGIGTAEARLRDDGAAAGAPLPELRVGEEIAGCRLICPLRHGGMASVWLARALCTGDVVVVKMIPASLLEDTTLRKLFARECQIALDLRHPHIVNFVRAEEARGKLLIVMEYVPGKDAERVCREHGGRLEARDVIAIGLQALDALSYAHDQGIVHRDLKPANILVTGEPGHYIVKLTDFGLAKYRRAEGPPMTDTGEYRGTLQFMAREQLIDCKRADHRADLFGVGATLYYLSTGRYVYDFLDEKDLVEAIDKGLIVPIERRRTGVLPDLCEAIRQSLRPIPDERYQTAREMSTALQQVRHR